METKENADILFEQLSECANGLREELNMGASEVIGVLEIIKMDLYQETMHDEFVQRGDLSINRKYPKDSFLHTG